MPPEPTPSTARAAPWRRAALALPLWLPLVSPGPALPEASPTPAPTARDAAVIFDDFRYVAPVDYSDERKSGSAHTLFGPNRWLEGPDLDDLRVGATPTRAWYSVGWQDEFARYPHYNCPTHRTRLCYPDNSLYDGDGAELYTEPVHQAPGHAVMRYLPGAYPTDRLVSLLLTSGFAARTGTWVARVRLPAFDGLDAGNGGVGVLLAPVWLKSSDEAWERRETWPENRGGTNWWEANIEIWRERGRWAPYADVNAVHDRTPPSGIPAEGRRYVSAGTSWWRYSSAVYPPDAGGDVHPANATFGRCTVVHRSPSGLRTSSLDQRACLDAMAGTPQGDAFEGLGHPYVYVMLQHTGRETRRSLYVRMEDAHGRPLPSTGFVHLLLDQEGQINYVDPGFFSAQLEMLLYGGERTPPGTIVGRSVDLLFDWFLYTPDTDLTAQEAPDLARTIQQRLRGYNAGRPAGEQVWRVNTTGLALEAPRREISPWATCNPWRIEPTKDWDFTVEKTDRNGRTYFTVRLLRDRRHDLRRMFQSVSWRVVRGGREVAAVRNEGYTLERTPRWGSDAPFDITTTVTQTSPVTFPPWAWDHRPDSECPDGFGPATRTHTYRYDPARGLFE